MMSSTWCSSSCRSRTKFTAEASRLYQSLVNSCKVYRSRWRRRQSAEIWQLIYERPPTKCGSRGISARCGDAGYCAAEVLEVLVVLVVSVRVVVQMVCVCVQLFGCWNSGAQLRLGAKEIYWTPVGERRHRGAIWQKKGLPQKNPRCISIEVLLCIHFLYSVLWKLNLGNLSFTNIIGGFWCILQLNTLYLVHVKGGIGNWEWTGQVGRRGFGGCGQIEGGVLSTDGGQPARTQVSPQGFALHQAAPVTCSISRTPGDHIASNTPDTIHYYHNGNGGSYHGDDQVKQ